MEYRVLGSLEVLDASGHPVPLGGTRQRTVLGSLLLRAGETVPLGVAPHSEQRQRGGAVTAIRKEPARQLP